jgi:glycosyltransferase involved in cell wall biosynthesis
MVGTILINGKFLASRVTGVQRYALELFRQMDVILQEPAYRHLRLVCLAPRDVLTTPAWKKIEFRQMGINRGNLWEQLDLPIYACGRLLFSPANSGPIIYARQVITFHDAAIFAVPEAYTPPFRAKYSIMFKALARIARLIITDSAFSKRELSYYLSLPPDRIMVIFLGGDHLRDISPDLNILQKYDLTKNAYFLSVSSQSAHKNIDRVMQAAELIGFDVKLVLVGSSNKQVFHPANIQLHNPNICMLGYVNDCELKALYENALGFIFPSTYEGFGLPVLEAMSCGCPVLCSNAASLPEVGGRAALYFHPKDVDNIALMMKAFLGDASLRTALQAHGYKQAAVFPWEKTARTTLNKLVAYL